MANTFTKTYQDGDPLLEDDLDNGFESVQPSLANLALSTTGSTSADLLKSNGSNTAPSWVSADSVAAAMSSTGANAIFADINASSSVTVCNAIVSAVTSCSATAANVILDAATSCSNTVANLILAQVTASTSAVSNVIADGVVRASGSAAGHLGVAVSPSSGSFSSNSTSFADVTNLSVSITTSGRPVKILLSSDDTGAGGQSYIGLDNDASNNNVTIGLLRDGSQIAEQYLHSAINGAIAFTLYVPPSSVAFLDAVAAGTYTYKIQYKLSSAANNRVFNAHNIRLVAYEL